MPLLGIAERQKKKAVRLRGMTCDSKSHEQTTSICTETTRMRPHSTSDGHNAFEKKQKRHAHWLDLSVSICLQYYNFLKVIRPWQRNCGDWSNSTRAQLKTVTTGRAICTHWLRRGWVRPVLLAKHLDNVWEQKKPALVSLLRMYHNWKWLFLNDWFDLTHLIYVQTSVSRWWVLLDFADSLDLSTCATVMGTFFLAFSGSIFATVKWIAIFICVYGKHYMQHITFKH